MRLYADTSALVTAYLDDETDGHEYRSLIFAGNNVVATSVLTTIELASAFHRAARAGRIQTPGAYIDRAEADCSSGGRIAVLPLDVIALGADTRRLLGNYILGSADAIHVATAIALRSDRVETGFVTRDQRQAEAARAEGFDVF